MADDVFLAQDLSSLLAAAPADSIVSRTVFGGDHVQATLFAFAPGQELSEHTASRPAILHVLKGEAQLTLGEETSHAGPGTWAYMPAHLPHSVRAETELSLLLLLLKDSPAAS
jgi:quercetin dioxygenase-like cupin family protein